ncbi:MAG: hypothetical protein COA63_010310 [Methylophaga sp.]|nr:hypothetical protein [Methylophaga sp.]
MSITRINTTSKFTRIDKTRIATAKRSYVTRNVSIQSFRYLVEGNIIPKSGQLLLARVDRIGQHARLEHPSGRRAHLFIGDEIIVSYGHRYAPDQFLSEMPKTLDKCELVASGGIASRVITKHSKVKNATKITPIGLLADRDQNIINLDQWTLPDVPSQSTKPLIIAVTGSSMNGGKTTTAANIVKGLTNSGLKVASAKITGTGSGLDSWKMLDAGAYPVIDFTDIGFASTYKMTTDEVISIMLRQINHLSSYAVDAIILEIADGLAQTETSALLESTAFLENVDAVFFAAAEALSVHSGIEWLQKRNLPVIAVSGALTASPVATDEARNICRLPILTSEDLISKNIHSFILDNIPEVKLHQYE